MGDEIVATVTVMNSGTRDVTEVIQVYVSQNNPSINQPLKELKVFDKVALRAGEGKRAQIKFSKKYAVSFWGEDRNVWIMERNTYEVLVGNSRACTPLKETFEDEETIWWRGL